MAFIPPKDRVLEHSTSNSQTVFAVTGAIDASFNAFSASMSVGDTTIGGVVEPGVAFASGLLTYSAANEVTITTVMESKGTFSSAGTKEVFMSQPAGFVGQLVSSLITSSVILASSGAPQNIAGIALSPGAWDVECMATFGGTSAQVSTDWLLALSTSNNTVTPGSSIAVAHQRNGGGVTDAVVTLLIPRQRLVLAASTNLYANAQASFSGSGYLVQTGGSGIQARRVS